jgi:hypothetical protein
MKSMMLSSLCFGEEISKLQFGRHILKSNSFLMTMRPCKGGVNTDMFSEFMLDRIIGNLDGSSVITKKRRGGITGNSKIC